GRVAAVPLRLDNGVADLDRPLLIDERAADLADHEVIFRALEEVGAELPRGADVLRHARGELRRVVVSDAHAAGPLAGEDRVGRVARHLTEHDRHPAILRLARTTGGRATNETGTRRRR